MNSNTPPRSKPAQEIRLGAVRAAIWRNETENGPRFNTTFSRIYKDGEQWNHSESFGRDDLLVLAKVADLAHSWIHSQGREPSSDSASAGGMNERTHPGSHGAVPTGTPPPRGRGGRELPLQR